MAERADELRIRKLSEHALREKGSLQLALLLEHLVPVARLRELARDFGLSPKGFRIDRAPARALAPLLAGRKDAEELDRTLGLLFERPVAAAAPKKDDEAASAAAAASQFKDQELGRLRADLERAREAALRAQERESSYRQLAQREADEAARLRAALGRAASQPQKDKGRSGASAAAERESARRLHEAELELEARAAADEALRRQLAQERSRVRQLEDELAELAALVPKGRKRKPPPPPPEPERRFLLPYLLPSFYKSLVGKDRRSVDRAFQAILLFCTEGHAYPGLEVKQLGGLDTWSLRASLGLRVYFRKRDDGDIEILELADREDQNTALRRLKER